MVRPFLKIIVILVPKYSLVDSTLKWKHTVGKQPQLTWGMQVAVNLESVKMQLSVKQDD